MSSKRKSAKRKYTRRTRKNETLIKNPTVLDTIKKYLTVREEEKNLFGEVFTPIELICEMLSKLPPKVWKNPKLKWLDPANGIGNFPIVVYYKLMESLRDVPGYKNKAKRSKHIIEDMLYMVELNPINVRICKKIFKWINPNAEPNIFKGSFLTKDYKDVNPNIKEYKKFKDIEKYDVIMGNPPFNKPKRNGEGKGQGGNDLYPYFVICSFKILKNDTGLLTMVHPPKWRAPEKKNPLDELQKILFDKIIFIKMLDQTETNNLFNVSASVDYYFLKNKPNNGNAYVIDQTGEKHKINLKKIPFLPNHAYKYINNILSVNGIEIIYSRSAYGNDKAHMKKKKKGEYKYPIIHTIKQNGKIEIYYSKLFKKPYFVPKVIVTKGLHPYFINDYQGKYGTSNYSFGIPIKSKKEGDKYIKAMNNPIFKNIISATKWNSGYTDHNMFKYFKKDFYKYFI